MCIFGHWWRNKQAYCNICSLDTAILLWWSRATSQNVLKIMKTEQKKRCICQTHPSFPISPMHIFRFPPTFFKTVQTLAVFLRKEMNKWGWEGVSRGPEWIQVCSLSWTKCFHWAGLKGQWALGSGGTQRRTVVAVGGYVVRPWSSVDECPGPAAVWFHLSRGKGRSSQGPKL